MACKDNQQAPRCLRTATNPTPLVGRVKCNLSLDSVNSGCPSGTTCTPSGTGQSGYCTPTAPKIMNDQSEIERTVINESYTRPESTISAEIIGYQNATVKCVGGYTQQIDSNTFIVGSTSDRGTTTAREIAIQEETRTKSQPVQEMNPPVSNCFSTKEIKAKAATICAQHPVCPTPTLTPTPTPIQTCSAVQKYSFESPCKMPVADDSKMQGGSNVRIQSTYTSINFTCADGYYESFRFRSCSTTESLLRQAQDTCRNHLVIKPTFGNKCLVPSDRASIQGSPGILPSETPKKGQMGFDSIKFSCPDGFVSGYEPKTCTTSASLNTYANKVCLSHLVCAKPTPTSTPTPTCTPLPKCATEGTVDANGNRVYCAMDAQQGTVFCPKPTPTPTQTCKTGVNSWSGGALCKTSTGVQGYTNARYQCSGDPEWRTATLNRCASLAELTAISNKVCANSTVCYPTPTLTPKPSVTPTIIKPTISKNIPPSVQTSTITSGVVGKTYSATITAKDMNPSDNLYMTISGLPFGIYQSNCQESSTTTPNGVVSPGAYISCTISGTAIRAGSYKLTAKVQDDKGASSSKSIGLSVVSATTTPR